MFIFLDTETTGCGDSDRLCQLAYKNKENLVSGLFKPYKQIPFEASAVNHITNKMVEDKEKFEDSKMKSDLQKLIDEDRIVVAHNAIFDVEMLRKEGMRIDRYIDTLKMAMVLDVKSKCKAYNMQYLRYHFGVELNVNAHSADGDVLVLEAIFKIFEDSFKKQFDNHIGKMIEISKNSVMLKVMPFGKHRGVKMNEVPRDYLQWLMTTDLTDKPDLAYTIDKVLK